MAGENGKAGLSVRQNIIQMSKFVMFSISAGAIQILSFTLLSELTVLPYWPKYIIALALSVLYNFTVNRAFTFKSAKNVPLAMFQVFLYYLVFTPLSTWWEKR
jgi:putative flippase GtrA